MKLDDVRSAYEELSSKASDIVRQLSLAGIAVVWLFRQAPDKAPLIDQALIRAALFVVVALIFDLAQYLTGAGTWFIYFRHKEKKHESSDAEFLAPPWLNYPTWALFFLKTAMMIVAYAYYIIPFLYRKFA